MIWLTEAASLTRNDVGRGFDNRSTMMSRPFLPLKAGAIVFTMLWTSWMMWWSGSFSSEYVVIFAVCGAAVGYLWYRAMRWQFERMGMVPRREDQAK